MTMLRKTQNSHQMESSTTSNLTLTKEPSIEQHHLMGAHAKNSNSLTYNHKKDGDIDTITNNNKSKKISHHLKGNAIPASIKPSVSITPVTSSRVDAMSGSGNGFANNRGDTDMSKKGSVASGGIEIIPLGHHHNSSPSHQNAGQFVDKSGLKSTKNPKDMPRRSLSENDTASSTSGSTKKKVPKLGIGGGSSQGGGHVSGSNKKHRQISDLNYKKISKSGDKKHSSSGSSSTSLKRSSHSLSPNNHGGKLSKLSSNLSIAKVTSSSTSPQLPQSSGGVIEIIPAIGGASQNTSLVSSSKAQSTSPLTSHNKEKASNLSSKSSSSGLKVTIKSSSSTSESKNRSDHRGGNPSNSSLSLKQRPSSSSSPSQQKYNQGTVSDKDRQRERERQQRNKQEKLEKEKLSNEKKAEEVRRILSGGKALNTTFQIPKLSSVSSSAVKSDDYVMMTSSAKASGEPPVVSQGGSKSANASPKYHGVSPKYGGGMASLFNATSSGNKGINTSPKLSPGSSPKLASVSPKSGNFTLPNASASPRYIGGGSVTPPSISPKHSMTSSSSHASVLNVGGSYANPHNSANQNPKSSPNHTFSQQSLTPNSEPSKLQKKPIISQYPGTKPLNVPMQGQGMVGNSKSISVPPSSDRQDVSSSCNSISKSQTQLPSGNTSSLFTNSIKNQQDQIMKNSDAEISSSGASLIANHLSQDNAHVTEEMKSLSQGTGTISAPVLSIDPKISNDTAKEGIRINSSATSNGSNNGSGPSSSMTVSDNNGSS